MYVRTQKQIVFWKLRKSTLLPVLHNQVIYKNIYILSINS